MGKLSNLTYGNDHGASFSLPVRFPRNKSNPPTNSGKTNGSPISANFPHGLCHMEGKVAPETHRPSRRKERPVSIQGLLRVNLNGRGHAPPPQPLFAGRLSDFSRDTHFNFVRIEPPQNTARSEDASLDIVNNRYTLREFWFGIYNIF